MPDENPSGTDRPETPDERSNYTSSTDPMEAVPKFDQGNTAWLNLPRRGSFEVEIVLRKKDEATGQYVYQVKGKKDGVLHNNGEWQRQEKLSECN